MYTDHNGVVSVPLLKQWMLLTAPGAEDIRLDFIEKEKKHRIVEERKLQLAILEVTVNFEVGSHSNPENVLNSSV